MNEPATILRQLDIAEVPGGFPVMFSLLTIGDRQFVGYYDTEHRMTVATRTLSENTWQTQVIPEQVGWDNHNYITIAADRDGYLHLSGNMHVVPLVYFRSTKPWDITTFERAPMVGHEESHATYPNFFHDQHGKFYFRYRDGGCGDSVDFVNVYDGKTRTWSRFLDAPLFDGQKARTAYPTNPMLGPDGWFHIVWVWREEPECDTTHDPGYARSRDLVNWETVDGTPIHGPITFQHKETIIDPIPEKAGLINGSLSLGFDSRKRPLALYHKFDDHGNTQAYVARFENGAWVPHRATHWDYRWYFQGRGGIVFKIRLGSLRPHAPGQMAFRFEHVKYGRRLCVLDEDTLEPLDVLPDHTYPEHLCVPESEHEDMQVWWREDSMPATGSIRHVLRWETLPHNRDQKPDAAILPDSMLRLYTLRRRIAPVGDVEDFAFFQRRLVRHDPAGHVAHGLPDIDLGHAVVRDGVHEFMHEVGVGSAMPAVGVRLAADTGKGFEDLRRQRIAHRLLVHRRVRFFVAPLAEFVARLRPVDPIVLAAGESDLARFTDAHGRAVAHLEQGRLVAVRIAERLVARPGPVPPAANLERVRFHDVDRPAHGMRRVMPGPILDPAFGVNLRAFAPFLTRLAL